MIVVGGSWFGSVKRAKELFGYFLFFLSKLHTGTTQNTLQENMLLNHGEWNAVSGNIDGVKIMAVLLKDL